MFSLIPAQIMLPNHLALSNDEVVLTGRSCHCCSMMSANRKLYLGEVSHRPPLFPLALPQVEVVCPGVDSCQLKREGQDHSCPGGVPLMCMLGVIRLILAVTGADVFTRTASEASQPFRRRLKRLLSSASPACVSVQEASKSKILMAA